MNAGVILEVIASAVIITVGAELLVRGASALALRLGVSPLFVGLTVVGFGTSSPELGASVTATLRGAPGISLGNVVGSNIFNVAVILGFTALLRPVPIVFDRIRGDLYVAIAVSILPLAAFLLGGEVTRPIGIASLCVLVAYVFNAYRKDAHALAKTQALAKKEVEQTLVLKFESQRTALGLGVQALLVGIGMAMLIGGSTWFVRGATEIAEAIGISEVVIGLTLVAVGTSLPELVTSIVAAYRNSADIAVGNILGSNIFNMLGILSVCAIVDPQPIPSRTAFVDVPVMFVLTVMLLPVLKSGAQVSRAEGAVLLLVYAGYCTLLRFGGM